MNLDQLENNNNALLIEHLHALSDEDGLLLTSVGELPSNYKSSIVKIVQSPKYNQRLSKVLEKFHLISAADKTLLRKITEIETVLEIELQDNNENDIETKQKAKSHLGAAKFLLLNKNKILNLNGISLFGWGQVRTHMEEYIAPLLAKYIALHREEGVEKIALAIEQAASQIVSAYNIADEQGVLNLFFQNLNNGTCIDSKTQALGNWQTQLKSNQTLSEMIQTTVYQTGEMPAQSKGQTPYFKKYRKTFWLGTFVIGVVIGTCCTLTILSALGDISGSQVLSDFFNHAAAATAVALQTLRLS